MRKTLFGLLLLAPAIASAADNHCSHWPRANWRWIWPG